MVICIVNLQHFLTGIHTLHALVDSIQKDIIVLKSSIKDIEKSHSKLLAKKPTNHHNNISRPLTFKNAHISHFGTDMRHKNPMRMMQNLEDVVLNITSSLGAQNGKVEKLERRHKSMRRTLNKALLKMEQCHKELLDPQRTSPVLDHFIEKQKEINGQFLGRMRYLEEQWKNGRPQSDAAPTVSSDGGFCFQIYILFFNILTLRLSRYVETLVFCLGKRVMQIIRDTGSLQTF